MCVQVLRIIFDEQYHPGLENLGDYNSKHHDVGLYNKVRQIYLLMRNSPLVIPRAHNPSDL